MANRFHQNEAKAALGQVIAQKLAEQGSSPSRVSEADHEWAAQPDGQPVNLTQLLKDLLNANDQKLAKVFVNCWFRQACFGNRTAIRELLNRIEGVLEPGE